MTLLWPMCIKVVILLLTESRCQIELLQALGLFLSVELHGLD